MRSILALAVLMASSAVAALAQGTYTQIDYPGAAATEAYGVDKAGNVSGLHVDQQDLTHGFFRSSNGAYQSIDYPGNQNTFLRGLNDNGQIVGETTFSSGAFDTAFVYDRGNETFTPIAFPGAVTTYPTAINNAGTVVGYSSDGGFSFGFELVNSVYLGFSLPVRGSILVTCVTSFGEVFGSTDPLFLGFAFNPKGQYERVTVPVRNPRIEGVNGAGTALVGFYNISSAQVAGFLYQNQSVQTLKFPGATETYANGISESREIVGWFSDAEGHAHGFTWTPDAPAEKK